MGWTVPSTPPPDLYVLYVPEGKYMEGGEGDGQCSLAHRHGTGSYTPQRVSIVMVMYVACSAKSCIGEM